MNRCIDADELMFWIASHDHELKDESNYVDRGMFTIEIIRAIEALLTAESARHGHWIYNPKDAIEMMFTLPKCSECGAESSDGGNYCSNCGATISEVKEDADFEEPEINPCRGCEDYDGKGGCLSKGGCGERREDAEIH